MASAEELQRALDSRDKVIRDLNLKFEFLIKENEELKSTCNELMLRLEEKEDEEEEEDEYEENSETMKGEQTNASVSVPREKKKLAVEEDDDAMLDGADKVVSQKKVKGKHVPIVTAYKINVKEIGQKLEKTLGHKDFNLKILGKDVTNIGVCTLVDFERLKSLLREEKVNFYTYTPRGERPISILIRGLSGSFEEREVKEYMEGLQIRVTMVGITKLGGDRWLFRIGRESDVKTFRSIKYILHCRIYMEKYRRKRLIQCFNCQRFGHVAINCNMPYRCVKCGEGHGPGKCKIPSKDENNIEILSTHPVTGQAIKKVGLPTKCANCSAVGHVASSKECPKRLELLRKMQAKVGNNPVVLKKTASPTGMSYAAVARAANVGNNRGTTGQVNRESPHITLNTARAEFDLVDGDCKRLLGSSFLDCLDRIKGFAKEYGTLRSDGEKSRALLGMLLSLQHNG